MVETETPVRPPILRFSSAISNQKFPFADSAALNPMPTPPLPEQIELHRDRMWRRDEELRVESAVDAERFIEEVGFGNAIGLFSVYLIQSRREKSMAAQ